MYVFEVFVTEQNVLYEPPLALIRQVRSFCFPYHSRRCFFRVHVSRISLSGVAYHRIETRLPSDTRNSTKWIPCLRGTRKRRKEMCQGWQRAVSSTIVTAEKGERTGGQRWLTNKRWFRPVSREYFMRKRSKNRCHVEPRDRGMDAFRDNETGVRKWTRREARCRGRGVWKGVATGLQRKEGRWRSDWRKNRAKR